MYLFTKSCQLHNRDNGKFPLKSTLDLRSFSDAASCPLNLCTSSLRDLIFDVIVLIVISFGSSKSLGDGGSDRGSSNLS